MNFSHLLQTTSILSSVQSVRFLRHFIYCTCAAYACHCQAWQKFGK